MTSASIRLIMAAIYTDVGFGAVSPSLTKPDNSQIAIGTVDDKVDQAYVAQRTIANTGTPDVLDLVGGGLFQPDGVTAFSVADLVTILIVNQSTVQVLTVGAGTNPITGYLGGTTPTKTVGKSGIFLDHNPTSGYPLTGGSSDKLQVATDGGTNVTYLIFLLGRSV